MLAWALYGLVLLLFATYPWLDRLVRDAGRPDLALLAPFVVAPSLAALTASSVGAVLASRRPRHPVGWLLLALGLSMAVGGMAAGYLPYTLIVRPGALPAADLLARIYSPSADVALAALGFVLLLTPTGSAPSARWRRWGIAAAGAMALLLVAAAAAPGSLDARTLTVEGPVGSRAFGGALRVANQLALLAAILIIPGRGGAVPADPAAGPGGGRPSLQPPPARRGPDHRGVRGPAPRPGRPGHPDRRGAGGRRPDDAADPGVAVAAAPGRPGRAVSRAQWRCW